MHRVRRLILVHPTRTQRFSTAHLLLARVFRLADKLREIRGRIKRLLRRVRIQQLDHRPVLHHYNPGRQPTGKVKITRRKQDGFAPLAQPTQACDEMIEISADEIGCRIIEDEHGRVFQRRDRKRELAS